MTNNEERFDRLKCTAHRAAWEAGKVVRKLSARTHTVEKKGPRDLVTEADHAAQAEALAVIRERHPDHRILAEEDPENYARKGEPWTLPEGTVWVVDPLDGTTNYTTGLPFSAVSVGALIDGQPVAGAIFDPFRNELFLAAKGQGATLNGRPLELLTRTPLGDATLGLDWAHAPRIRQRVLDMLGQLAPKVRTVRALGAAALALAYVASGRVHVYFSLGLQPWDSGAGAVMIAEVGGGLVRPDGQPWHPGEPTLLTGHPKLIEKALKLVSEIA